MLAYLNHREPEIDFNAWVDSWIEHVPEEVDFENEVLPPPPHPRLTPDAPPQRREAEDTSHCNGRRRLDTSAWRPPWRVGSAPCSRGRP